MTSTTLRVRRTASGCRFYVQNTPEIQRFVDVYGKMVMTTSGAFNLLLFFLKLWDVWSPRVLSQVPADEVCGCPLVKDVFEPTGEFCRVSKRKCNKHYCWEKLRRAEVDLERVRVVTLFRLYSPQLQKH